jgi:hypothetical protein
MAAPLQLRLTLRNIEPAIWRRIRVAPELTLTQLHHVIQILFGWSERHLWQYEIALQTYADYEDEFDELDLVPARTTRLADLPATLKRFAYNYDFGDDWQVEIAVEPGGGDLPRGAHVLCLEGARHGPPDDVGGPWAYPEFLHAVSNPDHREHRKMLEWVGGAWNPEAFSAEAINHELARWSRGTLRRTVVRAGTAAPPKTRTATKRPATKARRK